MVTAKNLKEKFQNNISIRVLGNIAITGMVFIFLTGCRSGKIITSEADQGNTISNSEMIHVLEQKSTRIQTLKIKRADLEFVMNGVQNTAKGNIAIYRDSIIAISIIPALGFEALRILCTKDSVIMINRMEKSYYASSIEHYRGKFNIPVGFTEIQAIFSNELFYYKKNIKNRIFEKQFAKKDENSLFIVNSYRDGRKLTNQEFGIDDDGILLKNMAIADYETRMRIYLEYTDFISIESFVFPQKISMDISERKNTIQLRINSGQIVINESVNVDFAVPSNYTKEEF